MTNSNLTATAFTLFAEVEIATPREGSTSGAHLHEGMLLRYFQNPEVSESLLQGSMEGKRRAYRMVQMLTRMEDERWDDLPTFVVTDPEGRLLFAKASGLSESSLYMSDGDLLRHLGEKFPQGLVLEGISQVEGAESLFLDFEVLSSMATVIGGTAEGIAAEAIGLVCLILNPDRPGVDQAIMGKIAHLNAGVIGWLSGAIQSKSILKRLMRGAKGRKVGGKIRNCSHIPVLNHEAGELPKVGWSIHDDRLRLLAKDPETGKIKKEFQGGDGKFDPTLLHQSPVAMGRAPMPMTLACELILLELEGYAGEPGTDLICGDGFGFDQPNEATETRRMTLEEMRHLRDGHLTNPECEEDVGYSKGTNACHEGDSDGDGDETEALP